MLLFPLFFFFFHMSTIQSNAQFEKLAFKHSVSTLFLSALWAAEHMSRLKYSELLLLLPGTRVPGMGEFGTLSRVPKRHSRSPHPAKTHLHKSPARLHPRRKGSQLSQTESYPGRWALWSLSSRSKSQPSLMAFGMSSCAFLSRSGGA